MYLLLLSFLQETVNYLWLLCLSIEGHESIIEVMDELANTSFILGRFLEQNNLS